MISVAISWGILVATHLSQCWGILGEVLNNKIMSREIKFRAWLINDFDDDDLPIYKMSYDLAFEDYSPLNDLLNCESLTIMQFTGFKDKSNPPKEIYEGDIISDWTKTDEGIIQSHCQVFWNKSTGSWHLDNSYNQDKSSSVDLWLELHDYDYKVVGNIYEKQKH